MTGSLVAVAVVVVSTIAGVAFSFAFTDPSGMVLFSAFGGVGAYLVARRPTNSIGWLLIATAWGLALGSVRVHTTPAALLDDDLDTATALAAWANGWGWSLAFLALLGVALVFPTGQMPGGRARWPSRIAVGIECLLAVALAFGPLLTVTPLGSPAAIDVPNPFAVLPSATFWAAASAPTDLFVLMFLVFFLGVGHLLIRWRRSAGLERLQYRWLVAALVLVAATSLIWAFATLQLGMDTNGPTYVLVVLSYPSVPLAIGIAVVRYRLYQIDRIISRTVGWAIVTAVLVAVFVALVVGLQAALTDVTQGQTLAVAASTLVAFALFQPVRRRVQRAVDRRFDRARYDAERTATAFADRLRDETDIAAVTGDLATTARAALAPTTLTVWLRTGRP